ncbi:MAG: DUF2116 family Zn-ribbon domain-containing protein [Candidatus Hadarchaeales archaeon]
MVEDHRHCIVCGKATSADKFFCSPSCEALFKQGQKRASRYRNLMMVIFFLIFALIMATYLMRSGSLSLFPV